MLGLREEQAESAKEREKIALKVSALVAEKLRGMGVDQAEDSVFNAAASNNKWRSR